MRKPTWLRRRERPTPIEANEQLIVEQIVAEFRADLLKDMDGLRRYSLDGGGEYNGSNTHYGLPEQWSHGTMGWLTLRGYVKRKPVRGDGTFYDRTAKMMVPKPVEKKSPQIRPSRVRSV